MLTRLQTYKEEHEQGFTLIELLVVILIIGILSAIAIPAFLNQRKAAVDSSLQSDLANSAKQIETVALKAGGSIKGLTLDSAGNVYLDGKSAADGIPLKLSDGSKLSLKGNTNGYCLHGVNDGGDVSKDPGLTYTSLDGGLKKDGGECTVAADGSANYAGAGTTWTGGTGGEVVGGDENAEEGVFTASGFYIPDMESVVDESKGSWTASYSYKKGDGLTFSFTSTGDLENGVLKIGYFSQTEGGSCGEQPAEGGMEWCQGGRESFTVEDGKANGFFPAYYTDNMKLDFTRAMLDYNKLSAN